MSINIETIEDVIVEAQRLFCKSNDQEGMNKEVLAGFLRLAYRTGRISVYNERIKEIQREVANQ